MILNNRSTGDDEAKRIFFKKPQCVRYSCFMTKFDYVQLNKEILKTVDNSDILFSKKMRHQYTDDSCPFYLRFQRYDKYDMSSPFYLFDWNLSHCHPLDTRLIKTFGGRDKYKKSDVGKGFNLMN